MTSRQKQQQYGGGGPWTNLSFVSSPSSFSSSSSSTLIAWMILVSSFSSTYSESVSKTSFDQKNDSSTGLQLRPFLLQRRMRPEAENRLLGQQQRIRRDAVAADRIACYACTYLVDDDHSTGGDCNDPFQSTDNTPEVMCSGSCHKLMKLLPNGGAMLVRGCMPDCLEKANQHGYNKCCHTKLCNRSTSQNDTSTRVICTLVSLILSITLSIHRLSSSV